MRETFGGCPDQIACVGQRHMSIEYEFQQRRVGATKPGKSTKGYKPRYRLHELRQRRATFERGKPGTPGGERLGTLDSRASFAGREHGTGIRRGAAR
jgi:hypothetical protein